MFLLPILFLGLTVCICLGFNSFKKIIPANVMDCRGLRMSGQGFQKIPTPSARNPSKSGHDELKRKRKVSSADVDASYVPTILEDVELEGNQAEPVNLEKAIESSKLFKSTRARQEALLDEKIARLKEEEDLIASDPSVGAVPEIVADRMIGRIAAFFGVPVFGGLTIFVGAFLYSKQTDTVIQPNIVAYATQVPFVLGLLGITYGILSASWEPENKGSTLGLDEFKTNVGRIKNGLERTRETAQLKDDVENELKRLGRKK